MAKWQCRAMLHGGAAVASLLLVAGCGAAPGPEQPSPTPASASSASPSSAPPASPSPSPTPSSSSPTPSGPSQPLSGDTLRELGFENGPLDEFSVPSDAVVSTRVDQPNVVTLVLSRPSPETVEDYLRATLPAEGFKIDARSAGDAALTFSGNGWTGGFTGTNATSAIVLRPAT